MTRSCGEKNLLPNMLHILWRCRKLWAWATPDRGTKYMLCALCWAIAIYKYNKCIHHVVITTLYLLQHDVHNYFVYKHRLPDKITHWRLVPSDNLCSSVASNCTREYVTYLETSLFTKTTVMVSMDENEDTHKITNISNKHHPQVTYNHISPMRHL